MLRNAPAGAGKASVRPPEDHRRDGDRDGPLRPQRRALMDHRWCTNMFDNPLTTLVAGARMANMFGTTMIRSEKKRK